METKLLRSEVLLELIFCAEHKEKEDEIIDEVLHAYLRKLNCFMVCILKKNDSDLIEKQLLPFTFKKDPAWQFIKGNIIEYENKSNNGFFEVLHDNYYYYIYQLTNYGYLVIGRKSSFDNIFINEFRPVVNLLSKILSQSIEDERRIHVEKKLADERRLLRTIIDNIPLNIYTKDLLYRKTLANAYELKHLGKSAESEVIGKTDFELYGESIGINTLVEDKKVLIDGESIMAEERYVTNGRWALVSKLPIKEEDGSITGMVGISVDFTEQKKSKDESLLFLKLLDNSSDAVQVTLETGELFYINKVAGDRLGIDPKDTRNYKVTDYLNKVETLEEWRIQVEKLKKTDHISSEGVNINQKTGKKFSVEVQVKFIEVNGIGYIIANSRDVTERKLAEDALKESENRFRLMADNSPVLIWTSGTDTLCNYFNQTWFEFTGRNKEQELGNGWADGVHPDDFQHCVGIYIDSFNARKKFSMEYRLKHADGNYHWLLDIGIPRFTPEGIFIGYIGSCVDITDIKNVEKTLRYQTMALDQSPVSIVMTDLKGDIEYANPKACETTGYTLDELIGTNPRVLKSGETPIEEYDQLWDSLIHNKVWKGIFHNKRKNGELYWESAELAPMQDEYGNITSYLAIKEDITERKKLEDSLRENEEKYRIIFSKNPQPMWIYDLDTLKFLEVNQAAIDHYGYSKEEFLSMTLMDIRPPEDLPVFFKSIDKARTLESTFEETRHIKKNGEIIDLEITAHSIQFNGKNARHILINDISKRKQNEIELQQSELKYRRITENISDVVWTTDMNFNLLFISPSIEKMVGEPIEIYIKRPLIEKFTKNSIDKIQNLLTSELEKEKDSHYDKNRTFTLEVEHYKADKTSLWIEMNMSIIRDEQDLPIGIQGVTRDVSQRKNTEIELRKSEERKASLIASMSDIVFVMDNDLILNETHIPVDLSNIIDLEPYLGKSFDEIPIRFPANDLIKNALISCIINHTSNKVEFFLELTSGRKWFEMHATVLNDQFGNQSGVTAIVRDITTRKQAEETIRQQLKMQDILIRISTIYININLDKVEEVIQNSLKELAEFVGADRAYIFDYDLADNTTTNTYEWCSEGIIPEISVLKDMPLEELPYFFGKHKKGEELCINDVYDLTDDGPGSLRAGLEAQDIKSLISIPMMSSGKLIGFVGFDSMKQKHFYTDKEKNLLQVFSQMLVNITERKRSESFLVLQEEKYRNIISNMNLGIIEVDKDENIIYANQSFSTISGYSIDELLSMNTTEFLFSSEGNNLLTDKLKLREKGLSDSYELVVKNKQGQQRWWFVSGAPNYADNHELKGSIGIHLDITEQKILEKELEKALKKAEQATKAQEMFLANMSHEIRTPLNVIIGMVRELNKEDLTKRQRDYVKHSETSTLHLLTIVNNILDMSKIQSGEFELDVREFSIASVATDVNSILHSRASDKNLNFILNISPEIKPALIGDPGRLRQILINLMGNSIKFTDSGFIDLNVKVLNTTPESQRILFEVIDSGIGMSEEFLIKLFDKFTQEEASSNRRFEGSGLGMSITKELVHLMGGTIEAKSQKGIGTQIRFELNFPIGDETKLVVKTSKISKNSFVDVKVLLVEDNEMNRFIAIQSLKITGCEITEAKNGLEAIQKLKEHSFDIILMDIQMPQMNGIEATKIIRAEIDNEIPIIALTANAFKNDIELYLSIGMSDYLIKPYKEEDLYRVIDKYIRKQETNVKLFDIEQLMQISRGDTVFVQNMLDLFVKLAAEAIVKLNEAFKNNDLDSIHKIAHKIKPSIDNLQIVKIADPIRQLEKYSLEENSESVLKELINVVNNVLENVIIAINKQ